MAGTYATVWRADQRRAVARIRLPRRAAWEKGCSGSSPLGPVMTFRRAASRDQARLGVLSREIGVEHARNSWTIGRAWTRGAGGRVRAAQDGRVTARRDWGRGVRARRRAPRPAGR